MNNQGGEISSQQAFTLAAHDLDNSNGKLLSQQGLTLRIAQALNNIKGIIAGASLDSHSDSLDNHEGLVSSRGELLLVIDKTWLTNSVQSLPTDNSRLRRRFWITPVATSPASPMPPSTQRA